MNYYNNLINIILIFFPSIGRKYTLLLAIIPLAIGWSLIIAAKSVYMLYAARLFTGLGSGLAYSNVMPMYLGEIASDKIRGSIAVTLTIMADLGVVFMYAVGPLVSISMMGWLGLLALSIFFATFVWMPESPYHLLSANKRDEAFKSLSKLRGHNFVQEELQLMEISVSRADKNNGSIFQILLPDYRRRLYIILGLAAATQLCGCEPVLLYSQMIFSQIENGLVKSSEANMIFGITLFCTSMSTSFLIDRLGRKPLLIACGTILACTNAAIGVYFFLKHTNVDVSRYALVPTLALMIFVIGYNIGLASTTFVLLSEIFPKNMKAVCGATYTIFSGASSFASSKLFQMAGDAWGYDVVFLFFAFCSCLFIVFVWILIPETKGKSLSDILDKFKTNNR